VGAAIWTAALSCVLILPIMSRLLPPLRIELLPARSAALPTTQMPAAAVKVESRQLETAARASGILPEGEASSISAEHPLAWETILAGIWISVATALLLRTLIGHLRLRAVVRRARPVHESHLSAAVPARYTDGVAVPAGP